MSVGAQSGTSAPPSASDREQDAAGAGAESKTSSGQDSKSTAWEERNRVIQDLIYGAKEVNYFSVNMGTGMSRAKYSLPNPYHVQNLLRSMSERLPKYQYQLVPADADV